MIRGIRVSDLARSLSLLVVAVVVAGCGEGVPTASELRPEGLRVGAVARPVVSPVAFEAGVYRANIGPEGGVLRFGIGSLTFPSGAVAEPTTITAVVDGSVIGVEFSPHGLTFPRDARPSLLHVSQSVLHGGILYVDDSYRIIKVLPFELNAHIGTVGARIAHFSKYIFGAS